MPPTTPPADNSPDAKTFTLANDLLFKTLFTRHTPLLADLINCVRHDQPPIEVVKILNPQVLPAGLSGKLIVMDIAAHDADGVLYNVEIQVRHAAGWAERNVFYAARALGTQLNAGEPYTQLRPVIGISLLVADLFPDAPDRACWEFTLRDRVQTHRQFGQSLQLHIIELSKAHRLRGLPPGLTDWITCLLHSPHEEVMSQITHPPAKEAMRHLETMRTDEQSQEEAFYRHMAVKEDAIRQWIAHDRGKKEGREEGREEGLKTGLEEGRAQIL
ncbi:MAG: Rpn family recombination-promoting nuclease/putative transposase, partial [Nevskiaceae bacterium]|nr:Rpn family recombination-promoting nuclease/putative transposase [Nevskiaceae bacterium]